MVVTVNNTPNIDPGRSLTVVPGAKLLPLTDLKSGDKFQYHGADPEDWNTVISVDDEKVHYQLADAYFPSFNWRSQNVYVWVKEAEEVKL